MLLGELGRQSEVSKLRFCVLYLARKRLSPIAAFVGTSTLLAQAVALSQGLSGKGAAAVEWPVAGAHFSLSQPNLDVLESAGKLH